MAKTKLRIKCLTPTFRVSFPSVFQASSAPGSDKKEFSLVALFDKKLITSDPQEKEAFLKMKQAMADCIRAEWGNTPPEGLMLPFNDGAKKTYAGYGEGIQYVRFATIEKNGRPGIVAADAKTRITEESEFYPGCYARATVTCSTWSYLGKNGVKFYLGNIQKTAEGEPLGGGRSRAEDDFSTVTGGEASPQQLDDLFD